VNAGAIIGGLFGLPQTLDADGAPPPFLQGRRLLVLSARCGLRLLIEHLAPEQMWMPSYLCGVMLDAVDPARTRLRFYPVDDRLSVASRDWLDGVRAGDLVLLIAYFGFASDAGCANEARRRGAVVVEDACQALLSEPVGAAADYVLYSPRKFLGVPDGGVLAAVGRAALPDVALDRPPAGWWLKAFEAAVLRREFDRHGGDRRWFELFREVEADFPIGALAMSGLSEVLLRNAFDYPAIARRRRENFALLARELGDIAIFRELPPGVAPLGFPVRVADRERVRQGLFAEGIYPPVHWDLAGRVPEEFRESHRLSREILTLVCDQRYSAEDMRRTAACVRRSLA